MGALEEFFISPILEKTGYNAVNTLVYAGIALVAVYALFHIVKKCKVKIDNGFFWGVLSFVLFGSTARVVTDAVDAGTFTGVTLSTNGYLMREYTITDSLLLLRAFTLWLQGCSWARLLCSMY